MGIIISLIIGIVGGVGQFFVLRYTLKPLAEGKSPSVGKLFFLKLPIPAALLGGCALIGVRFLPFLGGAFCVGMVVASVFNHFIANKKASD